jgi:hypothetical protein
MGVEAWSRSWPGGDLFGVAMTPSGKSVAVGCDYDFSAERGPGTYEIVQHDPEGRLLWRTGGQGCADEIALDGEGRIVVAGVTSSSGPSTGWLQKLDGSGTPLWGVTDDGGVDLAVGPCDRVLATFETPDGYSIRAYAP